MEDQDPPFNAKLEAEFKSLQELLQKPEWNARKATINSTLRLFKVALLKTGAGTIQDLLQNQHNHSTKLAFSSHFTAAIRETKWTSVNYICANITTLRLILTKIGFQSTFVQQLKIKRPPTLRNFCLPKKYNKRPLDDPAVRILTNWEKTLRLKTRAQSNVTIRARMYFYLEICRILELDLDQISLATFKTELVQRLQDPNKIREIAGPFAIAHKRYGWLKMFVHKIVGLPEKFVFDEDLEDEIKNLVQKLRNKAADEDDGSDQHRIDKDDLQSLYEASTQDPLLELFYLLLITTGMRIGGLSRIKTLHVARQEHGRWVPLANGRTLEKGRKWFSFVLSKRVRELVTLWLNDLRPADPSIYLFPGITTPHCSTATIRHRFQKLCESLGFRGKQYHPHSLRHSYAHILLEVGNKPEVISKLLNHNSTDITEKFYLRESAQQVTTRAKIPWLEGLEGRAPPKRVPDIVPAFLDNPERKAKKRKLERIQKAKEALTAILDS